MIQFRHNEILKFKQKVFNQHYHQVVKQFFFSTKLIARKTGKF